MTVSEARLYHYRLPLVRPLKLKSQTIIEREGLLIQIADQHGHIGWGEIAPLSGFSVESLEQARVSTVDALHALKSYDLPEPTALLEHGIGSLLQQQLVPSVMFGLEMAILNLWAQHDRVELNHLLAPNASDLISINCLLVGTREETIESARKLVANGYKTLKLKVGQEPIEREIARVKGIHEHIQPQTKLRLDANRAWDFETAVKFGIGVRDLDIEYIEEPLADCTDLESFFANTCLNYALDESMPSLMPEQLTRRNGLSAIILKPTILGGIAKTRQFATHAKQLGVKPVISSSFESSLGLVALAHLAGAIAPDIPCGLDTASWFAHDLISKPLICSNGEIDLTQFRMADLQINMKLLTEIPVS